MEDRFKALYFEYFKSLVKFARFYCNDSDEASSVVQQVFLNIWEKRDQLLNQYDLKSYLFTAVRNRVFNEKRRQNIVDELDVHIESDAYSAQTKMEADELNKRIQQTISQLPDRCRYIFELSRNEQMTYAQISEQLDISIKTVENQIGKALKILRLQIYGTNNQ